jgi:hypothetical protein
MRNLVLLAISGVAAVLSGCGGSKQVTVTNVPLTYSIGGIVAGLSGTIVLQNNGGDNLSLTRNGSFAFNVTVQPNATYDVTIATQPSGQVCSIGNGSGTATGEVTSITVACSLNAAATDIWTWAAGADYVDAPGVYGTEGSPAAGNTPGARREAVSWTDAAGNFWLFGGNSVGNVGMLNDIWKYTPSAKQWGWEGGSSVVGAAASYGTKGTAAAGNNPGAREGSAKWADAAGNLWLFGGDSLANQSWQESNDLWSYSPTSGLWTWVGGMATAGDAGSYGTQGTAASANLPPSRTEAVSWIDSAGTFWLFGGAQLSANGSYSVVFNDLWSYNPGTGVWTWVSGSSSPNAAGVYGVQGTASAGSTPGARMGSSVWQDASGNVWLFGGLGLDQNGRAQEYNDLWRYSPTSRLWTWIAGVSQANAGGVYGTQRAGGVGNSPGARVFATSWQDTTGNFWLFGGRGYAQGGSAGSLNDLWEYDVAAGLWTWIGGSSAVGASGAYGLQTVAANGDVPGARAQSAGWTDSSGNFWLFGGFGFDASGVQDDLNDLWTFAQSP